MNCLYCNQDLNDTKYVTAPKTHYRCDPCRADFNFNGAGQPSLFTFSVIHNDTEYTAFFDYARIYGRKIFTLRIMYDYEEQKYRMEQVMSLALELDWMPNFTPSNLMKKLPTILTFS
jgi:hypothetical protein